MDELLKIPPVTRFLLGATCFVTIPPLLQLVSVTPYVLFWPYVIRKWQFWRPITAFFYGGSGVPLLFDLFLLFRNSSDLEENHFFRRTAEYAWALIIMGSIIVAANYPLNSAVLFNPMLNALTYLWARANPHQRVSFFGIITVPAPYLPYAYLALDLIRGGPQLAVQSATGLAAAHVYYFLRDVLPHTGAGAGGAQRPRSSIISPPAWLANLLPDSEDPAMAGQRPATGAGGRSRDTAFGAAYAPRGRSFGDDGVGAAAGGNTVGGAGGSGAWLGGWGRGGASASSGGGGAAAAPNRDALLAAAERRLQAQRADSIAGRKARAGAAPAATVTPVSFGSAGSSLPQGKEASSTALGGGGAGAGGGFASSPAPVRRPAATGGGGTTFSFGQLRTDDGDAAQHDASSSGGRVAEERRKPPASADEKGKGKAAEQQQGGGAGGGYEWGGAGRKLGD